MLLFATLKKTKTKGYNFKVCSSESWGLLHLLKLKLYFNNNSHVCKTLFDPKLTTQFIQIGSYFITWNHYTGS